MPGPPSLDSFMVEVERKPSAIGAFIWAQNLVLTGGGGASLVGDGTDEVFVLPAATADTSVISTFISGDVVSAKLHGRRSRNGRR
jgi:hypothetical protein